MYKYSKIFLLLAACGLLLFATPVWATGGGGGGGGGGAGNGGGLLERSSVRKRPRTIRRKIRRKRKSRTRRSRKRRRAVRKPVRVVVVAPAKSINEAASRASESTARCTRFNKQFTSRRICMTRMMKQFTKDLEANAEKLPQNTPAKVETVAVVVESMAKDKPKEETLSALEQARSAFAVSMELAKEEDPEGEKGYEEAMQMIENVLEGAYEALSEAS